MGNVGSIQNMLKRIGKPAVITSDPVVVAAADMLILPGVGAFDRGMQQIRSLSLQDVLHRKVIEERTPVLGICLGMQLLTRRSEEGEEPGFGWIEAETVKFRFTEKARRLRIPHMGWNVVEPVREDAVFSGLHAPRFYFVHSYHVVCNREEDILGVTTHGYPFASVIHRDNIWGMQFHPEKSHKFGMKLLSNFVQQSSLSPA
jgi:glutamine amidotransferase